MTDSHDIDRWYEHYTAEIETREWNAYDNWREVQVQQALDSMTPEEFAAIYSLNEAMKDSKRNYSRPGLTKDQCADLLAAYKSHVAAYRIATAKWPVLEDGF
jgi:hypothetical protein